jgi:PAS domain S-box-containing protein
MIVDVPAYEAAFFILMVLLHSSFVLMYEASVYEWSPISESPGSKAHHRVSLVSSTFRCLAAFLFGLFDHRNDFGIQQPLVIYCSAYLAIVALCHWYEYPFFTFIMNYVHTGMYAICFVAAASALVGLSAPGTGDIICLGLFFIGMILLLPVVYSLISWRLTHVRELPISYVKTEADVELKVRILMADILPHSTRESVQDKSHIYAEIDECFTQHCKTFKNSFKFNQVWSTYLLICKRNRFCAMTKLRHILNNAPFFLDIVPIQSRLRLISSYADMDGVDNELQTYEEQVRLEKLSIEAMSRCLNSQLKFWCALVSEDYDLNNLERLTMEISKYTEISRSSLQRMVSLNPRSTFYRRLYSQFLINIANDEDAGKRQLTRAMELETDDDGVTSLTDASNCIVIVSGERESLGQILEANSRTCEIFGVSNEDVIGRNINLLMAKPYAPTHNSAILNYIQTKSVNLSTLNRLVLLKSNKGVLFEGNLQLREYPNFTLEPSIAFLGAIKVARDRNLCILRPGLFICEASVEFFNFFNVDLEQVKNNELPITRICPSFEQHLDKLRVELDEGLEYRFTSTHNQFGKTNEIHFCVSHLPYLSKDYFLVVVRFERDEVEAYVKGPNLFHSEPSLELEFGLDKKKVKMQLKLPVSYSESSSEESESDEESSSLSSLKKGRRKTRKGKETSNDYDNGEEAKSDNSVTRTFRSANLLRLGLSQGRDSLEPKLRALFLFTMLLLVSLCVMGVIVQLLWSSLTIDRYDSTLKLLSIPLRSSTTQGAYSAEMFGHLFRKNFFRSVEEENREIERLRRTITDLRSKTTALRSVVYEAKKGLSEEELRYITDVTFDLVTYEEQHEEVQLLEAVHLYNLAFTIILNYNISQLLNDSRPLEFLQHNRLNDIPLVWNNACMKILATQQHNAERVQLIEFYFMISAIVSVVCVIVTVFVPSMYFLLKLKVDIYKMFEKMDTNVLRNTVVQTKSRLYEFVGEQTTKTIDNEELMEVTVTKSKTAQDINGTGVPSHSRLRISFSRVCFNKEIAFLTIILCLTAIYFAGFYVWWMQARKDLFDDIATRVYNSRNRNWYSQKLTQSVVVWNETEHAISINLAETEYFEQMIMSVNHALYYGDPKWNISTDIRVMEEGTQMFSGSVCEQLYDYNIPMYNITPCESYHGSVLTRGAYEVFLSYVSLSQELRKTYMRDGINATLPYIYQMKEFSDIWIPLVGKLFDNWLYSVFQHGFQSASSTRTVGTVMFILTCGLLGGFVYYPMVRKLNQEMQITRHLLTIIPNDIIESSEVIRDQMRSIALGLIQQG